MSRARYHAIDVARMRRKYPFASLVRPHLGLMESVAFLPIELGAVDLEVAATTLGNLTLTFPHIAKPDGRDIRGEVAGGGSADIDPEQCWVRAVAEGVERYSTMMFSDADFIVAAPSELGTEALDLGRIPRCSADEYADPLCPLHPPALDAPIRWVPGVSLIDGRQRLVPAIMTHLHLKPWPAERFWLPISTGVAAHTRLDAAINAAICESIERDALALAWLLRLPLPRIDVPDAVEEPLATLLARLAQSNVRHQAFDATTDLRVPTVLAVQVTEGHPECELFVSCATTLGAHAAFAKAIREASPARAVLKRAPPCPDDVADFCDITHGASYYGRGGHRDDFGFLLDTIVATHLAAMDRPIPDYARSSETSGTAFLVEQLRSRGMEAVVVDLTADEVREAGLWVVRVIIPELVPISFVHRARYLGTCRLVDHPGRRPGPGKNPAGITLSPLPFA